MTKTHIPSSASSLRFEIGKATHWGLGAVDNWYCRTTHSQPLKQFRICFGAIEGNLNL